MATRYAAVSGIAVAALFGIGNAIWALDMPGALLVAITLTIGVQLLRMPAEA